MIDPASGTDRVADVVVGGRAHRRRRAQRRRRRARRRARRHRGRRRRPRRHARADRPPRPRVPRPRRLLRRARPGRRADRCAPVVVDGGTSGVATFTLARNWLEGSGAGHAGAGVHGPVPALPRHRRLHLPQAAHRRRRAEPRPRLDRRRPRRPRRHRRRLQGAGHPHGRRHAQPVPVRRPAGGGRQAGDGAPRPLPAHPDHHQRGPAHDPARRRRHHARLPGRRRPARPRDRRRHARVRRRRRPRRPARRRPLGHRLPLPHRPPPVRRRLPAALDLDRPQHLQRRRPRRFAAADDVEDLGARRRPAGGRGDGDDRPGRRRSAGRTSWAAWPSGGPPRSRVLRIEDGPVELSDGHETITADRQLVPVGCVRGGAVAAGRRAWCRRDAPGSPRCGPPVAGRGDAPRRGQRRPLPGRRRRPARRRDDRHRARRADRGDGAPLRGGRRHAGPTACGRRWPTTGTPCARRTTCPARSACVSWDATSSWPGWAPGADGPAAASVAPGRPLPAPVDPPLGRRGRRRLPALRLPRVGLRVRRPLRGHPVAARRAHPRPGRGRRLRRGGRARAGVGAARLRRCRPGSRPARPGRTPR